jgi:hypothetical protein
VLTALSESNGSLAGTCTVGSKKYAPSSSVRPGVSWDSMVSFEQELRVAAARHGHLKESEKPLGRYPRGEAIRWAVRGSCRAENRRCRTVQAC